MSTTQLLFSAIEEGRIETVRDLLSADSTLVNARNESGLSAILSATYRGRNDLARLLIDNGAQLDIFEAAATGTQDRLEQLLQQEPALKNSWSPDGWTPLHLAVFFGRVNIAHFLLSKGVDINVASRTDERVSPLHSALANPNNAAIAQLLIEHGADVNARQAQGYTPLHYAATYGLESIIRSLLQRSADKTIRNADGKTAFDLAVEKGHTAVAELLKPR
jgi:ankyrin repeat protein